MRRLELASVAVWSGLVFGVLEAGVLFVARAYPRLLAPYKVSYEIFWVAPVVDILLHLLLALALAIALRLANLTRRLKVRVPSPAAIVYGTFVFFGVLSVISAPRIVHPISAGILALGLAVLASRRLMPYEAGLTRWLRRRLLLVPGVLALLALVTRAWMPALEVWRAWRLPSAPRATSVLILMLDTVRRDSFDRGSGQALTPNLDRLIAQGILYSNAWAPSSWSLPSQASVLTGLYPHEHGADWPRLRLERNHPTLAEFFRERGYATAAFSGNANWMTPEYLGRGFLRFRAYTLENMFRRTVHGRKISGLLDRIGLHHAGTGQSANDLNRDVLRFLADYDGRPFFAYLCYMDVNQAFHRRRLNRPPWAPTPTAREVFEAYEQGLRDLDARVGELLAELEDRGVLQHTLVVLASDHGESFGSDLGDRDPAGHGTSLYPEQLRVPLALIAPTLEPARFDHPISLRELPSLIAETLKLPDSPFRSDAGRAVASSYSPGVPPIYASLNYGDRKLRSIIWGDWQYIRNQRDLAADELYDLQSDPRASRSLAPLHPLVPEMRRLLNQFMALETASEAASKNGSEESLTPAK